MEDFEDLVKVTESSGVKVLEMSPKVSIVQVEDGFSRPRLSALVNDGQRPYLADFRVVQVRRGSEDLLVKNELDTETWKMISRLTKTTFSAEEQLAMRQRKDDIEMVKLDAI